MVPNKHSFTSRRLKYFTEIRYWKELSKYKKYHIKAVLHNRKNIGFYQYQNVLFKVISLLFKAIGIKIVCYSCKTRQINGIEQRTVS